MRKRKLAVGQVWNALHTELEGGPWCFAIVAQVKYEGQRSWRKKKLRGIGNRWVAVKWGLAIRTIYTHVFDDYGREADSGLYGEFYFTRKSRSVGLWYHFGGFKEGVYCMGQDILYDEREEAKERAKWNERTRRLPTSSMAQPVV